jgi:hypothetical protein
MLALTEERRQQRLRDALLGTCNFRHKYAAIAFAQMRKNKIREISDPVAIGV